MTKLVDKSYLKWKCIISSLLLLDWWHEDRTVDESSWGSPYERAYPIDIKLLPSVVLVVDKGPSKGIGRVHGRSSEARTRDNQSSSSHRKQIHLQKRVLGTPQHHKEDSHVMSEGQQPLSNSTSVQVHLQEWTFQHVLVLRWHYQKKSLGSCSRTNCLSREPNSHWCKRWVRSQTCSVEWNSGWRVEAGTT